MAFPLIFIIVFANLGGGGVSVDVGVPKACDTLNPVYKALEHIKVVNLITKETDDELNKNLSKGAIDVILNIQKQHAMPPYVANIQYTNASPQKAAIFQSLMSNVLVQINKAIGNTPPPSLVEVKESTVHGREYKYIDFILPGMLGFSLLSSGVFGTAFVFLSLRLTLVIKRFFATPVKRYSIVLGEAIARLAYALLGALFIIMIGHYAFGFTLVHGYITVLNMLVLSAIGLIIFMGFGFIISGVAKSESAVPPFSNIITLPQFLLSGTFFSASAFPGWLQSISKVLPLTHLNEAMRHVAFEGASLGDESHQLMILCLWFIGVYLVAVKTFKWE